MMTHPFFVGLSDLRSTETFCDLWISGGDEPAGDYDEVTLHPVHACVLASYSSVLKRFLRNDHIKCIQADNKYVLKVAGITTPVWAVLLEYMYSGQWDPTWVLGEDIVDDLVDAVTQLNITCLKETLLQTVGESQSSSNTGKICAVVITLQTFEEYVDAVHLSSGHDAAQNDSNWSTVAATHTAATSAPSARVITAAQEDKAVDHLTGLHPMQESSSNSGDTPQHENVLLNRMQGQKYYKISKCNVLDGLVLGDSSGEKTGLYAQDPAVLSITEDNMYNIMDTTEDTVESEPAAAGSNYTIAIYPTVSHAIKSEGNISHQNAGGLNDEEEEENDDDVLRAEPEALAAAQNWQALVTCVYCKSHFMSRWHLVDHVYYSCSVLQKSWPRAPSTSTEDFSTNVLDSAASQNTCMNPNCAESFTTNALLIAHEKKCLAKGHPPKFKEHLLEMTDGSYQLLGLEHLAETKDAICKPWCVPLEINVLPNEVPRFSCMHCTFIDTLKCMADHMATRHLRARIFECALCSNKFRFWGDLKVHFKDLHVCFERKCKCCNETFTNQDKYRSHIDAVEALGPAGFQCPLCYKILKNRGRFNIHMQFHRPESERKHGCDMCPKRFVLSGDLRKHKRMHTQDCKFRCNLCYYKTYSQANLSTHRLRHGVLNGSYLCVECRRSFKKKGKLLQHMINCDHNVGAELKESEDEPNEYSVKNYFDKDDEYIEEPDYEDEAQKLWLEQGFEEGPGKSPDSTPATKKQKMNKDTKSSKTKRNKTKGGEAHRKTEGGEAHRKTEGGEAHRKTEGGEAHRKTEGGEAHRKTKSGKAHQKIKAKGGEALHNENDKAHFHLSDELPDLHDEDPVTDISGEDFTPALDPTDPHSYSALLTSLSMENFH